MWDVAANGGVATVDEVLRQAQWLRADSVAVQVYAEHCRRAARVSRTRAVELRLQAAETASGLCRAGWVATGGWSALRVFDDAMNTDEAPAGGNSRGGSEDVGEAARRRQEKIPERIEQLREREQELVGRQKQIEERLAQGSVPSPESVAASREHAAVAEAHAQDEHTHAARVHDQSSKLHEHTAKLHEHVADVLDEHGHPERARVHREAAASDRDAAVDQDDAAKAE